MIRKIRSRSHRFINRAQISLGDRLKKTWRRNRGLFLYMGIGCIFTLFLLLSLLWHQNTDASTHDVVQIAMQGSVTSAGSNEVFDAGVLLTPAQSAELKSAEITVTTSLADTLYSTPHPTISPAPEPTLQPAPSPTPPDLDSLISFYKLEADRYYNEYGYSSNQYAYTDDELYILAQLIYGEARGEASKGKIAVANVVMNRVLSRGYPGDTIKAVITASSQFTGYSSSIRPDSACTSAARQVLDKEVWVIPQNVYFFQSDKPAGENWGSHKYYAQIGGHCFYTESYRGRNRNGRIPPALYERVYKWPQYGCEPGKRVYRIQYMLNKLGYNVKADGYFGETTMEAIVAFQREHKMKADGVAGPASIKALIKAFGLNEYSAKFGN